MNRRTWILPAVVLLCLMIGAASTEPTKPAETAQWVIISDSILADLAKTYPPSRDSFATQTAGISIDRTNGDVYLLANNIGICKSTDQGQTFSLVSGSSVTGRFETGFGLNIDPAGGRLMCFSIYGSCAYSPDAGKSWIKSAVNHMDYGAVDWEDTGKALLAIGHESGGKLLFSEDAGKTWKTLGTNYWGAGVFDHQTLLSSIGKENSGKGGIVRTTDGGATWAPVSDEKLAAPVMVEFKGIGYWLSSKGLLVSKDKGASWSARRPHAAGSCLGPMFGPDALHMVVARPMGCMKAVTAARPGCWLLRPLRRSKYNRAPNGPTMDGIRSTASSMHPKWLSPRTNSSPPPRHQTNAPRWPSISAMKVRRIAAAKTPYVCAARIGAGLSPKPNFGLTQCQINRPIAKAASPLIAKTPRETPSAISCRESPTGAIEPAPM